MLADLLIPVEAQSWLPIREVEPIELIIESLFDRMGTLEFTRRNCVRPVHAHRNDRPRTR